MNTVTTQEPCILDHVNALRTCTGIEQWSVDEYGDPDDFIEADLAGITYEDTVTYYCRNCEHDFDSWEDAQAHLSATE